MNLYILEGKTVLAAEDLMSWATWMEKANRKVARTRVGDMLVSTVFLGIDHNFFGEGDPILFETLVFMPDQSFGAMRRYSIWAEAKEGHKEIVEAVKMQHQSVLELTLETIARAIAKPASA